ncbi:MAG: GNAT family N-acetyltransferase [Dehalobacter sp.]|nr:GNAT family N-acetyltransferase [Dehalobacter sp.]
MEFRMIFAEQSDEENLREILWEYGMDISGEIDEHVIVKENDQVLAGGKIDEYEDYKFYLEVLGVKSENRNYGLGGFLLSEMIKAPWLCCKNPLSKHLPGTRFEITTVARGAASGFYYSYGFEACSFSEIPKTFRDQCDSCPILDDCKPVPMIYFGGNSK